MGEVTGKFNIIYWFEYHQERCQQSTQTRHGMTARAWHDRLCCSLRGMARRKGIIHCLTKVRSVGSHHFIRRRLVVVFTRQKAVSSALIQMVVTIQTEVPRKHGSIQGSSCRECQSLSLILNDSRKNNYVRYEQVDNLLNLVTELREEVERLKSTKKSEGAI